MASQPNSEFLTRLAELHSASDAFGMQFRGSVKNLWKQNSGESRQEQLPRHACRSALISVVCEFGAPAVAYINQASGKAHGKAV